MINFFTTFLLIFLMVPVYLSAIPHEKSSPCYTFGDKVNLREKPDLKSRSLALLKIGTELTIISKSGTVASVGGYADHWYRVSFNSENGPVEGYIWGGMLSNQHYAIDINLDGKTDLVLLRNFTEGSYDCISMNTAENSRALTMRIVIGGSLIKEITLPTEGISRTPDIAILKPEGFDGNPVFMKVSYNFSSAWFGGFQNLFLLGGNGPELIMSLQSGGEGGDNLSHQIIMPGDKGGRGNTIIVIEKQEFIFEIRSISSIHYVWDNKKRRFIKKII